MGSDACLARQWDRGAEEAGVWRKPQVDLSAEPATLACSMSRLLARLPSGRPLHEAYLSRHTRLQVVHTCFTIQMGMTAPQMRQQTCGHFTCCDILCAFVLDAYLGDLKTAVPKLVED